MSNSMEDAAYVIGHLFDNIVNPIDYLYDGFVDIGMEKPELIKEIILIAIMGAFDFFSLKMDVISELSKKNLVIRWTAYVCLGLIIVFFSQKGVAAEFVYFQF